MAHIETGQTAPAFSLPADGDTTISLADYKGQKVVLYFYPKDDTPGCTKESCGFNDAIPDFKNMNTAVIGVSKCSVAKHDKFKAKYGLTFPLVSDEDGSLCEDYGVFKQKSMYGKTFMGIERSTFLIDEDGKIAALWRKVKVPGHVDAVRTAIEDLNKKAA